MLGEVVAAAARRFGDTPALVAPDGTTCTYAELDGVADEVAAGLERRGVRTGHVVALALPSDAAYAVAYVALSRLGAITVGVNPRLAPAERAAALAVVGPRLVLATPTLAEGLPDDLTVIEVPPIRADTDLLAALRGHGSDYHRAPPDLDRPVAIVLTSGTTGLPKGATFTGHQLVAVTRYDLGPDAEQRWGGGGPMLAGTQFAHVGFMTKFPWYVRTGATLHLQDRWRAAEVLDVVEATRMAAIGGVAPQIALMLRDERFDERDLSSVKALIVGGGPSSPALVEEARRRFDAGYSIRYSSTESGGVGTGTAFDAPDSEALHTVGRPRPGMGLEIRDEAGRAVEDGTVGQVCLRSDAVMAGYWGDPVATADTLRDGWLHTGDLGYLDAAGCLVLAGRTKEMFIRGGYNVYPMEVEAVLAQHPAVDQLAVVPRPDPVMGEVGVAVVVATDPANPPSLEELRTFGATRLARYKLPEELSLVPSLPLTAMQKLDRRRLAAELPAPPSGSGR
jgi:acyl-CoA synthetase (AMP-forming)/AMP-acid ligase II